MLLLVVCIICIGGERNDNEEKKTHNSMGNCVGGFKRRTTRIAPWKRNRTIVLCFLGLDGAGKTTIVKALQGEDFGTVHATMGFSRAEVQVRKYKLTVYDLGGSQRIRDIWQTYFAEIYALVFVVDSSALSRLHECKQTVDALCELPELMGKPILFLLNKKDLPEAMDEMQFSERFNLHQMAKRNKTDIRVEGVCAVKGTGKEIDQVIIEGLEWLIDKVLDNYDTIAKGVEQALKRLRERQVQERLERQHRLAVAASRVEEEEESPAGGSAAGSPKAAAGEHQDDVVAENAAVDGSQMAGMSTANEMATRATEAAADTGIANSDQRHQQNTRRPTISNGVVMLQHRRPFTAREHRSKTMKLGQGMAEAQRHGYREANGIIGMETIGRPNTSGGREGRRPATAGGTTMPSRKNDGKIDFGIFEIPHKKQTDHREQQPDHIDADAIGGGGHTNPAMVSPTDEMEMRELRPIVNDGGGAGKAEEEKEYMERNA